MLNSHDRMKLQNIALILVICLHLLVFYAEAITIPSDKNKPVVSKGIEQFVVSGPTSAQSIQTAESRTVTESGGEGGGTVVERTLYFPSKENPIQINFTPLRISNSDIAKDKQLLNLWPVPAPDLCRSTGNQRETRSGSLSPRRQFWR